MVLICFLLFFVLNEIRCCFWRMFKVNAHGNQLQRVRHKLPLQWPVRRVTLTAARLYEYLKNWYRRCFFETPTMDWLHWMKVQSDERKKINKNPSMALIEHIPKRREHINIYWISLCQMGGGIADLHVQVFREVTFLSCTRLHNTQLLLALPNDTYSRQPSAARLKNYPVAICRVEWGRRERWIRVE